MHSVVSILTLSLPPPPTPLPHTPRLTLPYACCGGWSASGSQVHYVVCILFASMCMLLWIHGDSICVMFSGGRLGSPRPCIHPHPPPALPPQDLCFLVHVVVDGLQVNPRCIVLSASSPFLSPHPPPPYPQTHTSICMHVVVDGLQVDPRCIMLSASFLLPCA